MNIKPLTTEEYSQLITMLDAFIDTEQQGILHNSICDMIDRLTEIRDSQAEHDANSNQQT